MEEGLPLKPIEVSTKFQSSLTHIYDYTLGVFGYFQAERYLQMIEQAVDTLSTYYTAYPECHHITAKNRIYRNIILDSHLIIYRITDKRIEVLDIIHSASSIRKIRATRNIRL